MATKYEVTIPYRDGMWYSAEAIANSKSAAVNWVMSQAKQFGFSGKHNKPFAVEVK